MNAAPIHVVHLVYRFAAGGLENVILQLVNGLPHGEFIHTIVALTEADSEFTRRIEREGVEIVWLKKLPGQPFHLYLRVYRLLRQLRPDVLHTCNIAALEFTPVAALAGVPRRVHAEHGWDVADPDGSNPRYRLLRRIYRHFVHEFIAVSPQLQEYLRNAIGVPDSRLHLIMNGVDTDLFRPLRVGEAPPTDFPFDRQRHFIVGTVGRLEVIKNQMLLVDAFIALAKTPGYEHLRLAIVGAGPLQEQLYRAMKAVDLQDRLWMPGSRADIHKILRCLDCFVLPSLAEGSSCTLQEAMASALPIIATDVGGSAALLDKGRLGVLVPSGDVFALSSAIARIASNGASYQSSNTSARKYVHDRFSMRAMLARYSKLFVRS